MRNRIIIYAIISLIFNSCASTKAYDITGNYLNGENFHWIRIEIINENEIKIKENNGGVESLCIGNYKTIGDNKILVNCKDYRGDNINKGSIVNIIAAEFSLKDEVIKIKKDKIIYKGIVLKKVP